MQHALASPDDRGLDDFLPQLLRGRRPSPWDFKIDRDEVARISQGFHKGAGTLDAVSTTVARYLEPHSEVIRTAHQPNFLASFNVVAQAAAQEKLQCRLPQRRFVQMFVLIDYDTSADRRYRHALFPSPTTRGGVLSLSLPRLRHQHDVIMFREVREPGSLGQFKDAIVRSIRQDLALLRKADNSFRVTWKGVQQVGIAKLIGHVEAAAVDSNGSETESQSEFTSRLLSRIVNLELGLPTMFVPGHQMLRLLAPSMTHIWQHWPSILAAVDRVRRRVMPDGMSILDSPHFDSMTAPLWFVCTCGRRLALRWTGQGMRCATAECPACGQTFAVDGERVASLAADARLVPRVVVDDLIEFAVFRHAAGVDYAGGLEHYRFSSLVAQELGIDPFPIALSRRRPAPPAEAGPGSYLQAVRLAHRLTPHAAAAAMLVESGRRSFAHSIVWSDEFELKRLAESLRLAGFTPDRW
jgi:hypothetical protein